LNVILQNNINIDSVSHVSVIERKANLSYAESSSPETSVDEVSDLVELSDGLVAERMVIVATRSNLIQAPAVLNGQLGNLNDERDENNATMTTFKFNPIIIHSVKLNQPDFLST